MYEYMKYYYIFQFKKQTLISYDFFISYKQRND